MSSDRPYPLRSQTILWRMSQQLDTLLAASQKRTPPVLPATEGSPTPAARQ